MQDSLPVYGRIVCLCLSLTTLRRFVEKNGDLFDALFKKKLRCQVLSILNFACWNCCPVLKL